jgi:hypothetical protein
MSAANRIEGIGGGSPRGAGGITGAGGKNVNPAYKEVGNSEAGIAQARKAIGAIKPDASEVERRLIQDKAREVARIRKQGRNTR